MNSYMGSNMGLNIGSNKAIPKIRLIAVTKPREYAENIPELVKEAAQRLRVAECEVTGGDIVSDEAGVIAETSRAVAEKADLIVYLIGTWILAPQVVSAVRALKVPFCLWSLTTIANFALGGATVTKYTLQEMGVRFKFIAGLPEEDWVIEAIAKRARAAAVAARLAGAKFGEIGGKSMGMYNATIDEFYWKQVAGFDLPHYDTYWIIKNMERVSGEEAREVLARVKETVGHIVSEVSETGETLNDEDLLVQCKIYLALKKLVEEEGLDAIGNKCQPELSSSACGLGWAACLSHSLLNDDGIMCACEADMPSCVTMFILNRLTGQTVFFGDLNSVVREKGAIRLINCGSGPLSMAKDRDSIALWPVPAMMGYPGTSRGATTSFPLRPGLVTIAKLGGGKGTARIHMATGTVLDMPLEPRGLFPERWPQAVIRLDGDIDSFLEKAIGQHYLLVYGDWKPELAELCDILGVKADI